MNVTDLLRTRVESMPDAAAIIDFPRRQPRTITFLELDKAAEQVATLLHRSGLRQGDRVLLLYPMSAELYIALIAILRLGLIAMFLDPSAQREHLASSLAGHLPQAMIGGFRAQAFRLMFPSLRQIPMSFSFSRGIPGTIGLNAALGTEKNRVRVETTNRSHREPIAPCVEDSPALITFTSGTGQRPKAALRTHGFLLAQYQALDQCVHYTPGAIDLSTLPVFVLANLGSGMTSVIPDVNLSRPDSVSPARVIELLSQHRVTQTGGSPALMARVVDYCLHRSIRLHGLERIYTGGGPVLPQLLEDLHRVAPSAQITALYGSTEAEPIASLSLADIQEADIDAMRTGRGLLVGTPVASIQLRILQDRWGVPVGPFEPHEFQAACRPTGGVGEIVVSGDHVLTGYLSKADEWDTKFQVGTSRWHRTGDAGTIDEQGRLWLLGRCSSGIEVNGEKVYPFPVELVARQHPDVRNAAMVLAHGERTLAIEPHRKQVSSQQFEDLRCRVPSAQVQRIRIVRRIPVDRRHNAKIDYDALRTLLESRD
jgi:olefin beta-lactone synthetase